MYVDTIDGVPSYLFHTIYFICSSAYYKFFVFRFVFPSINLKYLFHIQAQSTQRVIHLARKEPRLINKNVYFYVSHPPLACWT